MAKFQPGQSGNPKGRPPGSGKLIKLRAAILNEVPEIIAALVGQAKEGDTQAAKLLLERVFPPFKPEAMPTPFELPEDGGPRAICEAIIKQVATGTLSAEKGVQLVRILGWQEKITENIPTGIVSDEPEPLSEEEFCARHGIERDV